MPSRLKLTAAAMAASVASGVTGGVALVVALAGALGACIDGDGLDLERSVGQDATTIREASAPLPDATTHPVDAACSSDLAIDPNNCGACGHVCVLPSSLDAGASGAADAASEAGSDGGAGTLVAACMASACTVGCAAGHADCNGNPGRRLRGERPLRSEELRRLRGQLRQPGVRRRRLPLRRARRGRRNLRRDRRQRRFGVRRPHRRRQRDRRDPQGRRRPPPSSATDLRPRASPSTPPAT